jgi:uncharacterized repeat protein (TIGR01451 family)
MHRFKIPVAAIVLVAVTPLAAGAVGTPAGTDISSQATVVYSYGGNVQTQQSNVVTTTVGELLAVDLVWQDAAPVPVYPGAAAAVLTYRLTNTGNGTEAFALTAAVALPGDDFDPLPAGLYLDTDGDGLLTPATDSLYQPGSDEPLLTADGWIDLFVVNGIPDTVAAGQRGDCTLTADCATGTGAPGLVFAGGGDGGVDAIVGATGGTADRTGSYIVAAPPVDVQILKAAVVDDGAGGHEPIAGATITYTLTVGAGGDGTARGVVITDAVPDHTTYHPNSLTLNGAPLSDAVDTDAGDVGGSSPATVTVALGDLPVGAPVQVIAFTVTID